MQGFKFAEILLPLPIEKTYTYTIPQEAGGKIKSGIRVLVNFGKRKLYTGIVLYLHNDNPEFEPKPLLSIIDEEPFVTDKQIELWKWMADYYCCNLGEILNAAIHSNLIPSSETKFFYIEDNDREEQLNNSEIKIIELLRNNNNLGIREIIAATEIKNPVKILESLEKKEIISFDQGLKKNFKPLVRNIVCFNIENIENNLDVYEKILKQNSKQKEIIDYLYNLCEAKNTKSIQINEKSLLKDCNVLKSSLKSLEAKKIIELKKTSESRIYTEESDLHDIDMLTLTETQDKAYYEILDSFNEQKPVLLHGVTSSGKTEIYIKLIEKALNEGKTALYLLPEIALTSQIIERLKKYFGNIIGVYHSKYSANIRSEIYKLLLEGKLKIILGVRSSIFLPFKNLGLIIIDEEHETSYKQFDPDPRYNARDMGIVLSKIHDSNVILGSATPSLESYYNSKSGKYSLVELDKRYGNVQLPLIETVNIKDAYRRKIMRGHFHPVLIKSITDTIENNEQIILFQNRRGYSPYLECKACGWVPHCKNCNVSLTYHKYENKLVCHYCGEKIDLIHKCEVCPDSELITKGFGTERIEDEIVEIFPKARVARLDYDTASSRKKYEKIICDFENHDLDILIGTQIVTKGLDFNKVSLVGILNADNMLNFPDFRAYERSFQLIMQVSGRAGRRDKQGKVIIQTFNPEHTIIKDVISNNYKAMFNLQVKERKLFRYPPFWNFIIIKLKNKDRDKLFNAAFILASELRKDLYGRVKGPEEPLINKINNLYIINIHIRFEKSISPSKIKNAIVKKCKKIKSNKEFGSLLIEIDVDPV